MMKTYRVAIVGLGRMGSTLDQSIASASRASQRLEVVAGAETIPERRAAFREKWGIEAVYEDYQEMIEKEKPDLVGVCTTATGLPKPGNRAPSPNFRDDSHADIAVHAANAGVPMLFVEKAISCSVRKADAVLEACRKHGTVLNTGVLRRFSRRYKMIRELIERGDIGEPQAAVVYGAASLMHVHIHWMDTVSYLLGDPQIAAVRGDLLPRDLKIVGNGLEVDPQATFQIAFANGIEAWSVPVGGREYEVVGTEGTVRSMRDGAAVTFRKTNTTEGWPLQWEGELFPEESPVDTVVSCLDDLVDSYESGRPSLGNIEVTHHITEACITVAESHRQGGTWIQLPMANRDLYVFHV
ncbi:Gfo/Idh/MocA family oxidoreductase [Candidatus Poribacteria bacterium]|nr:Gfo/Idh/MocA family oxidoreductase [Candidatus Poribacteria bacterium]